MRALSVGELLTVWECGLGRGPLERGLILLAATYPENSSDDLLHLSIGQRDARLLAMREATFGPQLECEVTCPTCGNHLELNPRSTDLLDPAPAVACADEAGIQLVAAGWRVRFRLLDSQDLLDLGAFAYVTKPFSLDEIEQVVERAVAGK